MYPIERNGLVTPHMTNYMFMVILCGTAVTQSSVSYTEENRIQWKWLYLLMATSLRFTAYSGSKWLHLTMDRLFMGIKILCIGHILWRILTSMSIFDVVNMQKKSLSKMWNEVSWMKFMPTSAAVGWQTVQESPTPYRVMLQRMAWWRPGSGPGWNCASQGDSACPGWIEDIKCLKITYAGCCSSKNIGVTNDKFYFATTRDLAHLFEINPSHKSTNASDKYSTIHHFVTEICTHVQISVIKWRIVGYLSNAFWDLCNKSVTLCQRVSNTTRSRYLTFLQRTPEMLPK